MRRLPIVALAVAFPAALALPAPAAAAQEELPGSALLLVLPEDAARASLAARTATVGLGVYPPSRAASVFIDELGFVSSPVERGLRTDPDSERVATLIASRASGAVVPRMRGSQAARVLDALGIEPVPLERSLRPPDRPWLSVLVLRTPEDIDAVLRSSDPFSDVFVLGVGTQTPVLLGRFSHPQPNAGGPAALFAGEATGRRATITPYEFVRAILATVEVEHDRVAGQVLHAVPHPDPLHELDQIEARLGSSAGVEIPLTAAAVAFGLTGLLGATFARARHRRGTAAAFARATAVVPAGYLGALFIDSEQWEVRATAIAGAFVFGLTFVVRDTRRFCGWVFVGTSAAIAALTLLAARSPDGAIADALWGNPLNSWRFFGLRNHLASFASGGVLVGAALLAAPWPLLLAAAASVAALLAAATLGANFVGVFTLVLGAVLAVLVIASGRARILHAVVAVAAAVAATLGAMLADAWNGPASHGGRAVQSIREGGFGAARGIIEGRWRLSLDEVLDLGGAGIAGVALVAAVLTVLLVGAWRSTSASLPVRAGVIGGAAMALAALVAEDSGFFTAGLLGLFPWVASIAAAADRHAPRHPEAGSGAPAPPQEEA